MTNQVIVDKINKTQNWDDLMEIAVELLEDIDLDEDIFQAIEKRQDELYMPTEKEIASKKLDEALEKFHQYDKRRQYAKAAGMSKTIDRLKQEWLEA